MTNLEVQAFWDDDAGVWYATSDDVAGLCVQADSFDELIEIANGLTPDLLELNHVEITAPYSLHFTAERTAIVQAA